MFCVSQSFHTKFEISLKLRQNAQSTEDFLTTMAVTHYTVSNYWMTVINGL